VVKNMTVAASRSYAGVCIPSKIIFKEVRNLI
jgi:hypothetical protein